MHVANTTFGARSGWSRAIAESITATTVRCEPVVVGQAASARTRRMCHCCA
jgi:hypothetical protein